VAEVAGVNDQVRGAQGIETRIRQAAIAPRQVRICDQGEADGRP
jgi:hypothetical protein